MLRFALFLLLALVPVSSGTVRAASGPVTVFQTVHGVRLSLTVPRASYPANALVRAVIAVRNTTRRTISVYAGGPPMPQGFEPQVQVFNNLGRPMDGPIDLFLPYPGPAPTPQPILPGKVMRFPRYVVLQGPYLQTQVTVTPGNAQRPGTVIHRREIVTPRLRLTLTAPDTPDVALRTIGGQLTASVHYTDITPHSLRYEDAAQCGQSVTDAVQNPWWVRVKGSAVRPGCPQPVRWRAVVGTLNHSVAWIRAAPGA